MHVELERALVAAQQAGVAVWRSTRCQDGRVIDAGDAGAAEFQSAGALTPTKARIDLMLRLMPPRGQAARSS